MRKSGSHLNGYRKRHPMFGPSPQNALYGYFRFRLGDAVLAVISSGERHGASELETWEHVSVSVFPLAKRLPTWTEMQAVKDLFWDRTETVIEIHPPDSDHVNVYDCLHLWKPPYEIVLPPTIALAPAATGR